MTQTSLHGIAKLVSTDSEHQILITLALQKTGYRQFYFCLKGHSWYCSVLTELQDNILQQNLIQACLDADLSSSSSIRSSATNVCSKAVQEHTAQQETCVHTKRHIEASTHLCAINRAVERPSSLHTASRFMSVFTPRRSHLSAMCKAVRRPLTHYTGRFMHVTQYFKKSFHHLSVTWHILLCQQPPLTICQLMTLISMVFSLFTTPCLPFWFNEKLLIVSVD